MEAQEVSPLTSRIAEKFFRFIFPVSNWPDAVERLVTVRADEPWFDHRALLRWADDGGRWQGEGSDAVQEVRK